MGRWLFGKHCEALRLFGSRNRELQSHVSAIKCVGANVIIRCEGIDRYLRPIDSVLNSVAQSKRKTEAVSDRSTSR